MVKNPPAMRETWGQSLGWEDPLEERMATASSILAWRIPWTEEPGGLQSMGSHRVGHDPTTKHRTKAFSKGINSSFINKLKLWIWWSSQIKHKVYAKDNKWKVGQKVTPRITRQTIISEQSDTECKNNKIKYGPKKRINKCIHNSTSKRKRNCFSYIGHPGDLTYSTCWHTRNTQQINTQQMFSKWLNNELIHCHKYYRMMRQSFL